MIPYRQAAVTAYICLLVGTFVIFASGATGFILIKDPFVWFSGSTFAAGILTPLVVAFKIPDFWKDDPSSVANLQRRYTEEQSSLKKTHADEIEILKSSHIEAISKKETARLKEVTEFHRQLESQKREYESRLLDLERQIPKAPPAPRPRPF